MVMEMDKESGIWQHMVKNKYLKNDLLNTIKPRLDDSPVWKDLLKVRPIYLKGRKIKPNNGERTLLWSDPWLETDPLHSKFSTLYELCEEKTITIKSFILKNRQIGFRRWLPDILYSQWEELRHIILASHTNEINDEVFWAGQRTKNFLSSQLMTT